MKAEHRHELKSNDLAKSLMTFGDYAREYGGRVALGLAIVILVIVLIRNRIQNSRAEAMKLREDLAYARQQVDRLRNVGLDREGKPSVTPNDVEDARRVLTSVKEKASDKTIQAEALVTEGDYYWGLANYPDLSEKAGAGSLAVERNQNLKQAKEAYQQVVDRFADQTFAAVAARFGLAAIAENARDWDAAKTQYQAVLNTANADKVFKNLAEKQLKMLSDIQKPVLVGPVPEKLVFPSPATAPTTAPATQSAAPTTKPVAVALPTTKPATQPAEKKPASENKPAAQAKPANDKPATPAKPTTQPAGK